MGRNARVFDKALLNSTHVDWITNLYIRDCCWSLFPGWAPKTLVEQNTKRGASNGQQQVCILDSSQPDSVLETAIAGKRASGLRSNRRSRRHRKQAIGRLKMELPASVSERRHLLEVHPTQVYGGRVNCSGSIGASASGARVTVCSGNGARSWQAGHCTSVLLARDTSSILI